MYKLKIFNTYKIFIYIELIISLLLIGNWLGKVTLNNSTTLSITLGIFGIGLLITNITRRFYVYVICNGDYNRC